MIFGIRILCLLVRKGKVIAGMSLDAREQLRVRLREHLPATSDGQILYESFANAVRGRVRG